MKKIVPKEAVLLYGLTANRFISYLLMPASTLLVLFDNGQVLTEKRYVMIDQPRILNECKFMGGVDLHNMVVALYRINIRAKRFHLRIIFHLIDVSVVNGRLFYRRHLTLARQKNYMSLMGFHS